jgi:hypothetical protein
MTPGIATAMKPGKAGGAITLHIMLQFLYYLIKNVLQ